MSKDVSETLRDAQAAVDKAELDGELRQVGFLAAVFLGSDLAPKSIARRTVPPAEESTPGAPLEKLARRVDVDHGVVEDVFFVNNDGGLQLGVARGKLGRRTAEAARQVALLTAVARQADDAEQFTAASVLRSACQEYGVFDTGNFAKTLLAMKDVFQFKGSGVSRSVRVVKPGYEEAGRVITDLTS
jgi:hypothetical protein